MLYQPVSRPFEEPPGWSIPPSRTPAICAISRQAHTAALPTDQTVEACNAQEHSLNATTLFGVLTSEQSRTSTSCDDDSFKMPCQEVFDEVIEIGSQQTSISTGSVYTQDSEAPTIQTALVIDNLATVDCLNELTVDHDIAPLYRAYSSWAEALEAQSKLRPVYELAPEPAVSELASIEETRPQQTKHDSALHNLDSSTCVISTTISTTLEGNNLSEHVDSATATEDLSQASASDRASIHIVEDWDCATTDDWTFEDDHDQTFFDVTLEDDISDDEWHMF